MPNFDGVDDDATNRALRCVLLMVDRRWRGPSRNLCDVSWVMGWNRSTRRILGNGQQSNTHEILFLMNPCDN